MRRTILLAAVLAAACSVQSPARPSDATAARGEMASKYADTTFVASRGYLMPAILARNSNGLATEFHSFKMIWAPALYKYTAGPFTIKEQRDVKEWTLCIMDNTAVIAPQAGSDPDVQPIPDRNLDQALTGQRLNAANTWLAKTDFGVTATSGQTVRQVLVAILLALGHSPEAANEL